MAKKKPATFEDFEAAEKRVGPNALAVLYALRDLGTSATAKEVTQRVVERGEWSSPGHPTGTATPAQRGEPYQGVVYQHLRNFVRRGLIRELPAANGRIRPKLYEAIAVPRKGRGTEELLQEPREMRKRAAEAIALRAEGTPEQRSYKEVGEAMGIATTYAHELCTDPYGDKSRERKEKAMCVTPGCRRPSGGSRRCHGCSRTIDELMPTCRIERWVRRVALERRITINFMLIETDDERQPFVRQVEVKTPRGTVERTLKKGDTWSDALGACGIDAE